ncbi:hypothetical protein C6A87_005410 [Mycobacterium sp. ITM-2016-00317]|uniref:hypothetical protein n=1 Tax=Mycobacterium sp. ITM-2016-00317 TaxID=2099694 RepID=UPI00287F3FE2|nr:hypothetical protein [Mycobacterium sp. ITM-2016-00317]WNG88665.1 hypothetical protein C6A87_005410 [Mycobacterium sp. ITM-2016-00317]
MDILDADDTVIGQAPAPVAVVSDNGPCFRRKTFQTAFTGEDPCCDTSGIASNHRKPTA